MLWQPPVAFVQPEAATKKPLATAQVIGNMSDSGLYIVPWVAVVCGCGYAAIIDLRERRIPNSLTLTLWSIAVLWHVRADGISGLGTSLFAGAAVAFPFVLLFLFGGGGAGDAKLMCGVGTWLGLNEGVTTAVFVVFVGAIWGVVSVIAKGRIQQTINNIREAMYGLLFAIMLRSRSSFSSLAMASQNMTTMPYGVSIFLGVLFSAGFLCFRAHQ